MIVICTNIYWNQPDFSILSFNNKSIFYFFMGILTHILLFLIMVITSKASVIQFGDFLEYLVGKKAIILMQFSIIIIIINNLTIITEKFYNPIKQEINQRFDQYKKNAYKYALAFRISNSKLKSMIRKLEKNKYFLLQYFTFLLKSIVLTSMIPLTIMFVCLYSDKDNKNNTGNSKSNLTVLIEDIKKLLTFSGIKDKIPLILLFSGFLVFEVLLSMIALLLIKKSAPSPRITEDDIYDSIKNNKQIPNMLLNITKFNNIFFNECVTYLKLLVIISIILYLHHKNTETSNNNSNIYAYPFVIILMFMLNGYFGNTIQNTLMYSKLSNTKVLCINAENEDLSSYSQSLSKAKSLIGKVFDDCVIISPHIYNITIREIFSLYGITSLEDILNAIAHTINPQYLSAIAGSSWGDLLINDKRLSNEAREKIILATVFTKSHKNKILMGFDEKLMTPRIIKDIKTYCNGDKQTIWIFGEK